MKVFEIIPEGEQSGIIVKSLEDEAGEVLADCVLSDVGTETLIKVKTIEMSSEKFEELPEFTGW